MEIQILIDELQKIKDNSYPVLIEDGYLEIQDNLELERVINALDSIKDM